MLEIEYEASRITGKGQEDSPPETESVVYKTNLSMGDGHSVIVGSNTAAKTSLLLVSVQKQ